MLEKKLYPGQWTAELDFHMLLLFNCFMKTICIGNCS